MITDDTLTPKDEAIVQTPETGETASAQPENVVTEEVADSVAPPNRDEVVATVTEEVAVSPDPTPAPTTEVKTEAKTEEQTQEDDSALFEAALADWQSGEETRSEGAFKKLSRGDRLEATVIQVDKDKVFVDLGTKSEGVIPLSELSEHAIEHPSEAVKAGDKIQVVVIKPEGADGNAVVSKKRADFEDLWDRIEDSFREEKTLQAQVIDRVKGGLVVDIGVRGFVPATHVGNGKHRNIEKYVGQSIPLKIIEIDRDRKKVVLSNRQADEERRAAAKDDLFTRAKPGDVLDGTVRRLTDYGAFVDLGGVDGLLHISEMSWMRISHPKEMFKEGQKIQVMVLRLDSGVGKISLGHRQVLPDPWNLIKQNYSQNQKFNATIGRLVANGAFVKLPEGAEAFIPTSEMSNRRLRRPDEAVKEGDEVEVQIIDLRPDERRMVLSMRATGAMGDPSRVNVSVPSYDDDDRNKKGGKKKRGGKGGRRDDDYDDSGRRGYATGGATIGERLGMLKGLVVRQEEDDDEPEAAPAETETEE